VRITSLQELDLIRVAGFVSVPEVSTGYLLLVALLLASTRLVPAFWKRGSRTGRGS
jgi:hypothetical protein